MAINRRHAAVREDVWHRLDLIARQILPFFVTLLLIMVAMVPLRVPLLSPVIPALPLIAVYYWSVHKPNLMPVWAIFLIGLFHDLLTAGPPGVGILSLLVESLRRLLVGAGFLAIWLVFVPVAAAASLSTWLLTCLIETRFFDPDPTLFQFFATIAGYPCLAWVLSQLQRTLVR
jgi:rod shape-determining protein MreD